MLDKLKPYKKTIAALIGALIVWGNGVVDSAPVAPTAREWMGLAFAAATAAGVYRVTNEPTEG
jgi:hypothetical protein